MVPTSTALPPASTGSEVYNSGAPAVSAYRYRFVDSNAAGCLAPSVVGSGIPAPGSPAEPAKGCPMGWDEIANASCLSPSGSPDQYFLYYDCSFNQWPSFTWYGGSYSAWWMPQDNGYLNFYPTGIYCGTDTRLGGQLPQLTSVFTGCSSSGTVRPVSLIAAMWTNLNVAMPWVSTVGTCWDVPPGPTTNFGHIWVKQVTGTAPNNYVTIEYDRVLVNTNDGGCLASPNANHYATFEFKVWLTTGNVDVIYLNADHSNQAFTMGIQNQFGAAGTAIGLNYCSPLTSCNSASPNIADLAVRYYPDHQIAAIPMSVSVPEDCIGPIGCNNAAPDKFSDPDYGDNGGPPVGTQYCYQTAPQRGTLTGLPSCASGWGTGPISYTPYTNYNGQPSPTLAGCAATASDCYQYKVKTVTNVITGPATANIVITPTNDPPTGYDHAYQGVSNDWLFVPPSQGLVASAPLPTDVEIAPMRSCWGNTVGYPTCTGGMQEAAPIPKFTVAMTSCPGYDSTWLPQHGTVTFVDYDGVTKTGVHPTGSFNYKANAFVGPDSFRYCVFDGTDYQLASVVSKVNIDLVAGLSGFTAHSDTYEVSEDGGPVVGQDSAAPSFNDDASGCTSGLEFRVVPGTGPSGAGSWAWNTAASNFAYTPLPDWSGDDMVSYQLYCPTIPPGATSQYSNVATIRISVLAINDQPTFNQFWKSFGDLINEDNGVTGASTPPAYTRTVTNFMTQISPSGGADEFASQTVRAVIVSQSNTGLFNSNSIVPCPGNYDFSMVAAACPSTLGPSLDISGPIGNQVLTLKYITKPDANGSDTVCFRVTDSGPTNLGGKNQNPMPPTAPLCFIIKISAVADVPRPVDDVYTIYQGHELFAPVAASTFPPGQTTTYTVLQGNPGGTTPDLEVDGEALVALPNTNPTLGKLWYVNTDGSFHYSPPPGAADSRVNDLSPNLNKQLKPFVPATLSLIGSEKFRDLDASTTLTNGEAVYLDLDGSNTITAKDLRLTPKSPYVGSSVVVTGDTDAYRASGTAKAGTTNLKLVGPSSFPALGVGTGMSLVFTSGAATGAHTITSITTTAVTGDTLGFSSGVPATGDSYYVNSPAPLVDTVHTVTCFADINQDGQAQPNEPIYLQVLACGPGTVQPFDVRMSSGAPVPGATLVAAGDPDVAASTHDIATKYCFADNVTPTGYSAGDQVYLDLVLNACSFVTPGDVIFSPGYSGPQTFKYTARDTSGATAVGQVTINILPNNPPVGTMWVSSAKSQTGSQVAFGGTCTDADPADKTLVLFWDFGDGYTALGANPVHMFLAPGTYSVTYICYDPHGDYWSKTVQILVVAPDLVDQAATGEGAGDSGTGTPALVANAGEDQSVVEKGHAALAGSASGGLPTVWTWTQVSGPQVTLHDADKATASFDAPDLPDATPALLAFHFVVGDGAQDSLPDTVIVTVTPDNDAPVVVVAHRVNAHEGDVVTLDALASTDPNGDALTFQWTHASGPAAALTDAKAAKASFVVPAGSLGQTLVYSVEVSDGKASTLDSVAIVVVAKVFDGPGFSTEVANDGLVTVTPIVPGTNFVWDFGDGSMPVATDGAATHTYAQAGTYTIHLTARDANGAVLDFRQGVPVTLGSAVHDASRPEASSSVQAPAAAAWMLVAAGAVLTAGLVALGVYVKRRAK
ncbi:MAG: PKD domain-containing protein [bacterium]